MGEVIQFPQPPSGNGESIFFDALARLDRCVTDAFQGGPKQAVSQEIDLLRKYGDPDEMSLLRIQTLVCTTSEADWKQDPTYWDRVNGRAQQLIQQGQSAPKTD